MLCITDIAKTAMSGWIVNTNDLTKLNIMSDDISDEDVDFDSLESMGSEEDDDFINISEPKNRENLASVNSDDSVRIYLQQIGKIPLLSLPSLSPYSCFHHSLK